MKDKQKEKHQCEAQVYPSGTHGSFNPHRCERNGKNFEDGKWWCKVHTSSVIQAKEDARSAKFDKECNKRTVARERIVDDRNAAKAFRMALEIVSPGARQIMLRCLNEVTE